MFSHDEAVREHAEGLFGDLTGPGPTPHVFELPPRDHEDLKVSFAAMAGTINFASIAAAHGSLLLHSGAVARPDGGCAVLCGPSGSGKSTLTSVLTQRGHAYVTDETVCLDATTLRITPYRKPVSVKPGSHGALEHLAPEKGSIAEATNGDIWLVPPTDLGGAPLPDGPLDPRVLVFPTYEHGSQVRVERLGEGETAHLLGGNSSALAMVEQPLESLARLVRRAPAYRIVHGDVRRAADEVERLLA